MVTVRDNGKLPYHPVIPLLQGGGSKTDSSIQGIELAVETGSKLYGCGFWV